MQCRAIEEQLVNLKLVALLVRWMEDGQRVDITVSEKKVAL